MLRMPHAFRIGPIHAADASYSIYATRLPSGDVEVTQSDDDVEGLRMLVAALHGQPLVVEPALAKAGKRLGLRRAPLPAELVHEKATMALVFSLALHELVGPKVGPSLVGDLLDAAAGFSRAAPWRFVDGDTPLRVEVLEGKRRRTIDAAIMGQAGLEFGVALYLEQGMLSRLLSAIDPERMAERTHMLAVSLEPEPPWVVAAVEPVMGAALAPMPMHLQGRRPRKLDPADMALLTAVLRAASELGPGMHEARGTSALEPRVEAVVRLPAESTPSVLAGEAAAPGPKVGRNAPCPCGSGKKYKRCCMRKDEAAGRAEAVRTRPSPDGLSRQVRLVLEIVATADEHVPSWRSVLPPLWQALADDPMGGQLMMPLLAYQYRFEPDLTAAHVWERERGASIDPGTRELFEAERDALLSVWEVLEVRPEEGLVLVDLLTGEQRFVHERSGTRGVGRRHAVLARVSTVRGRSELAGVHPQPLTPAASHHVVTAVRRGLGLPVAPVPRDRLGAPATVEALLTQWQAACSRLAAAEQVERPVQNTDGEPFEPHEDHFALTRGSKRRAMVEAVLSLPGTHLDGQDRREAEITFTKPGNAMHPHWRRTVIGTATITDRSLVLEANSRTRIDALRAQLEQTLGAQLEHRERKRQPVKTVRMPIGDGGPIALDAQAYWGLWHPGEQALLHEEARHFLERPHDALGGLTPRQAVAKASSRRALHQLLKEQEFGGARPGAGGFAAMLREALDLSPTGELQPVDAETRRTGRGRKSSETLLEFAGPMLEDLHDEPQLRPALELAAMVWNAEVLDRDGSQTVEAMQAMAARAGLDDAEAWLRQLHERRRLFAEDERIIDVLEVRWEDGDVYLKTLARIGPPRRRKTSTPRPRKSRKKQLGLFD